jgi:hypothetical protein
VYALSENTFVSDRCDRVNLGNAVVERKGDSELVVRNRVGNREVVQHFQKFDPFWRVSRLTVREYNPYPDDPRNTGKVIEARIKKDELDVGIEWKTPTSFQSQLTSVLHMTSGQKSSSKSVLTVTDVSFEVPKAIEVLTEIPNGTVVNLTETPQIKAVWQDGKVVRVYNARYVDDLSGARFQGPSGRSWFGTTSLLIVLSAAVFAWIAYRKRLRA